MDSTLAVTVAASDKTLLTQAERRAAAGLAVTDNSQDLVLADMDLKNAAVIATECQVAVGSGGEPTLRQETLTETFRRVCRRLLILSRRHNVTVSSIDIDGVTLSDGDYTVDPEAGILRRLSDDYEVEWAGKKIVVVYQAGFSVVPPELRAAASDFLRANWLERERDPFVKSEEIEIDGIDRTKRDYWIGSIPGQVKDGPVPDIVAGQLERFRNASV